MNICKYIGHQVTFYDSGYQVCNRCNSHEYYHEKEWEYTWFWVGLRWYWVVMDTINNIRLAIRFKSWSLVFPSRDDEDIPF